jgi:hypothetical protein
MATVVKERNVDKDLNDLLGNIKPKDKGITAVKAGVKKAVKVAAKAVPKKVVTKPAPKVVPKIVGRGVVIGRGAVVKTPRVQQPVPRRTGETYAPESKINVIDGARAYKKGGNVEALVMLMKQHKTVGKFKEAALETNNPLRDNAIGVLGYLCRKNCVEVV